MRRSGLIGILTVALIGVTRVITAHHSQRMFIETPVWITGTVVKYRPVDPHVMIELHEAQAAGSGRKWIVEGPRRGRLDRILQSNGGIGEEQVLKLGDRIAVCGFPLASDFKPERMYADWPPEQGRFVHGQVMVMPDGRMQSWGPYGMIDNCVRSNDTAKAWIGFLDRDALAHTQWCDAMLDTRMAHRTPKAFIASVNRGLATGCS